MPDPLKRGLIAILAAAALIACAEEVVSPTKRGACWHMVVQGEAPPRFNQLPGAYPSIEYCAAALELVRIRGGRQQITGGYQGQFLFAVPRGVYVAQRLKGARYLALVRTGDGRLVVPGAMPQQP